MRYGSKYFDKRKILLLSYETISRLNSWKFKKIRNLLIKYVTFHKSLLDIGSAYGHFLGFFADFDCFGMDISSHAVKVASSRSGIPFKVGDVSKRIPFDKKFDIITAIDVLEHLHDPRSALTNIYNSLNKRGLFVFEIPTVNNFLSRFFYNIFYSSDKTHVFIKTLDEIRSLAESFGFELIDCVSTTTPFFFHNDLVIRSLSNTLLVFRK